MKIITGMSALLILVGASDGATAQGNAILHDVLGKPYEQVRKLMLKNGYQPVTVPAAMKGCPGDIDLCHTYGELSDCAADVPLCWMEWKGHNGERLKIEINVEEPNKVADVKKQW